MTDKMKYKKGQFIKNKDPYEGEGEYLIVDFDYLGNGVFNGYKCRQMKAKHCPENDFNNFSIIHKTEIDSYEVVG